MQPIVTSRRAGPLQRVGRHLALQRIGSDAWRRATYHGLDMQASYTWSKCMANSLGYFGSYGDEEGAGESQTQATQNFFQNEYNPMGDYGRCTIDTAQDFGAYGVYNLPFGRGRQFANNVNRGVDAVIGGWQMAARYDTSARASASHLLRAPIWATKTQSPRQR